MKKIIISLILFVACFMLLVSTESYANVYIEDGNLVEYDEKILSSGVPDGLPAEEALKLFTGENAEYTIEGKKSYTSWNFGFPIDTRYTRTDRIISYSKKGEWREKSVELDIKEKQFMLMLILSSLGLLSISLSGQEESKKKNLFLCYGAIFISVVFTMAVGLTIGKYSATAGYLIGLLAIGLAGKIFEKKLRYGFWGAVFFAWSNAEIGSYAHLSTDKSLLMYVFFIISIGAIAYLTASILNHVFFRRETAEK